MPSSGSAAKANAAGKASAKISLSCTDVHDHQLLLVLCILSAAAGTSAAGTASEASLACTPADTCLGGLLLHVLLLCSLLPAESLHLLPEPARQLQFVLLLELPATANMCASRTAWVGSDNPLLLCSLTAGHNKGRRQALQVVTCCQDARAVRL